MCVLILPPSFPSKNDGSSQKRSRPIFNSEIEEPIIKRSIVKKTNFHALIRLLSKVNYNLNVINNFYVA